MTQPCGGDLVGSWTVINGCADARVAVAGVQNVIGGGGCPGLTIGSVDSVQAGTLTFASDMTFTSTVSVSGTTTVTLPPDCLGGQTCAQVGTWFLIQGLSEGGCTGTSSCTCPIPRPSLSIAFGTYSVADTMVSFANAAATPLVGKQYCVTGSTLHLMNAGGGRIADDIVLTRVSR